MQNPHTWWSLTLPEWASIINAATVVALACLNVWYLKMVKSQANAARDQASESQRQADAAMESLEILKSQFSEDLTRGLFDVIVSLRQCSLQVQMWERLFAENKFNQTPLTVRILPQNWPSVISQAGRVSKEQRDKVLRLYQLLSNAQFQVEEFISGSIGYRKMELIEPARLNLVNAMPNLANVIAVFEHFAEDQARLKKVG